MVWNPETDYWSEVELLTVHRKHRQYPVCWYYMAHFAVCERKEKGTNITFFRDASSPRLLTITSTTDKFDRRLQTCLTLPFSTSVSNRISDRCLSSSASPFFSSLNPFPSLLPPHPHNLLSHSTVMPILLKASILVRSPLGRCFNTTFSKFRIKFNGPVAHSLLITFEPRGVSAKPPGLICITVMKFVFPGSPWTCFQFQPTPTKNPEAEIIH